MGNVGFPGITASLTFTAHLWVLDWLIWVVLWGRWTISVWEAYGIGNAISLTVGMVFWAAPIVTVERFSLTCGVVVAACWVIVGSLAALKVVICAAIAFSNTLS